MAEVVEVQFECRTCPPGECRGHRLTLRNEGEFVMVETDGETVATFDPNEWKALVEAWSQMERRPGK